MRSLAAFVLGALACNKPAPPSADAGAPATSCSAVVASYDALLALGGACATDADCACAKGGVSPAAPCGHVTDKVTAAKLDALGSEYEAAHCDALMCAAWMCTPSCSAGRCVNSPPAPVVSAVVDAAAPSTSWTACASDLDCTYVSLGCCDTTPVNRAHVADAKRKLERSGHPYCPPKAACGPSPDGTWSGAPGKCSAGNCVLRSM